jgi:hypothetical protein
MSRSLLDHVRTLLLQAAQAYRASPAGPSLQAVVDRLDEPLRVAIAGKVKAGKSTLLNALVGERLAPTDAGECTRIVTWYRDGHTYRVTMHPVEGPARQVPFTHEHGAMELRLGATDPRDVERLEVEWPSASLRATTLIDTPGIASLSSDLSQRTHAFLAPDDDQPTTADAVIYLMRHLHATDVRLLEAFHDDSAARAAPINTVGVLSRADEVGAGRVDALHTARRIAKRYRADPQVRRLCQTVVPVAGLLAESASTLREDEFRSLRAIAGAERSEVEALLLSADRFREAETDIGLSTPARDGLLARFGLFGVRLADMLIRRGVVTTADELAAELLRQSGLQDLRGVLTDQFSERQEVLRARSALAALESCLRADDRPETPELMAALERLRAGAHEFAEIRLLNALATGAVRFSEPAIRLDAERLLGAHGRATAVRLGLPPDASADQIRQASCDAIAVWRRRAESPLASPTLTDAAQIVVRSCEGHLMALT